MLKEDLSLLNNISLIEKNQIYLLDTPKTPQQNFLHLFAHRHLLRQKMLHKNIEPALEALPGSFAQSSLKLAYLSLCLQNQLELPSQISSIVQLIQSWIDYYPTVNKLASLSLTEVAMQGTKDIEAFGKWEEYITYLNLISVDLWKLIRRGKKQEFMFSERPIKEELNDCMKVDFSFLEADDLLSFLSSCLPKMLLNIVLQGESLPQQMRSKFKKYECLFSNQSSQYLLRSSVKLSLLLRQIMAVLLTIELTPKQQKFFMILTLRYYYVYHFERRYFSPQFVIYVFNKLEENIRKSLYEEFALFFKIICKLGKQKFMEFVSKNSEFMRGIVEMIKKKPMIGYTQEGASPYNALDLGQTINIERGIVQSRYFQILNPFSLFYFKILVKSLDVTVRLYYLGEIGSAKPLKTLLFSHEKLTDVLVNCINVMKPGLYVFEFDNSYSWINNKTIVYEYLVYNPLEMSSPNQVPWIGGFYENIIQNELSNKEDIYVVVSQKKAEPKQKVSTDGEWAIITKFNGIFGLRIQNKDKIYTFESDSKTGFIKKIKEMMALNKYRWRIRTKPIEDISEVQEFIEAVEVNEPKPANKLEEPEVDRSEVKIQSKQVEINKNEVQKVQVKQQKKVQLEKKEKIVCSFDETSNFYDTN